MFSHITPSIKKLLFANIGIFVFLQMFVLGGDTEILGYFILYKLDILNFSPPSMYDGHFNPVQLLTHFFSHIEIWHIAFNMMALASIGPPVEAVLGSKRFIEFYLISGLVSGILVTLFDPSMVPVIGASGAISGVILAFGMYYPRQQLVLFFVIPVAARNLVIGIVVISLLLIIFPQYGGNISHFGHLSGIVAAALYFYILSVKNRMGK